MELYTLLSDFLPLYWGTIVLAFVLYKLFDFTLDGLVIMWQDSETGIKYLIEKNVTTICQGLLAYYVMPAVWMIAVDLTYITS